MLEKDYTSHWLGIEVLRLADGHATTTMLVREEMLNGFGIAHGGMVFAFADTTFALAGERLTAVADRSAGAGRSGIYDITITATDDGAADGGRLVALFRGRSRTVPSRRNQNLPPSEDLSGKRNP
jgi:acyl-CoA thioesterase